MSFEVAVRTYKEGFAACDSVGRVIRYLAGQCRMDMTRDEAQANVDARCLLINRVNALIDEIELEYLYGK